MKMKKIFMLIFVFLFIFSISSVVNAVDYPDNEAYREVTMTEHKDEAGIITHVLDYRIYNYGGMYTGSVIIDDDLYNYQNWFVYIQPNGFITFCYPSKSFDVATVNLDWLSGNNYLIEFKSAKFNAKYYSKNSQTWVDWFSDYSYWGLQDSYNLDANNFLWIKNVKPIYANNQNYTYNLWNNNQNLYTPSLSYVLNTGFRVNLNEFLTNSLVNDSYIYGNQFDKCNISVYDFNKSSYLWQDQDVLINNVELDDDGNGFITFDFENGLKSMIDGNGDYLITINSNVKSTLKTVNISLGGNLHTQVTNYNSYTFFRFQWYADSGVGLLVPCDSEGNFDEDDPGRFR